MIQLRDHAPGRPHRRESETLPLAGLALDDDNDSPQLMAWLAEGGRSGGKTAALVHDLAARVSSPTPGSDTPRASCLRPRCGSNRTLSGPMPCRGSCSGSRSRAIGLMTLLREVAAPAAAPQPPSH